MQRHSMNKKPGPRTKDEIENAAYSNAEILRQAKELVAYGVKRGWIRFSKDVFVLNDTNSAN